MTNLNEIVGDWLEDFEQRVEKSVRDLIRAQGESVTVADSYLKAMERINKENVAIRDAFLALQDVLGLHEETCGEMGLGDAHRGMCVQDEQDYPCDTRQAINNRIGVE